VSPPKVWNKGEREIIIKKVRFSKPNFVRKTMCETIEKIAL
jgi:hypothetical protein